MPGRVDVEVEVVEGVAVQTVEANAFRVLPDGPDFLLDFVEVAGAQAQVQARIRVARGFVPSLIDRCTTVGV
jgi:hypothetical protein